MGVDNTNNTMRLVTEIPATMASPLGKQSCSSSYGMGLGLALLELTKPKLAIFSVLAAAVGYTVTVSDPSWLRTVTFLFAAALAGGGALSLNQWLERGLDPLMARTCSRPLVRGALSPRAALTWGLGISLAGVMLFAVAVSLLSAAIAASIVVLYAGVYTPLKRRTVYATEAGALAGALPPILGAAAAGDIGSPAAGWLALIVLFWQMPHFYAICAYYRDDYRAAGFRLLPAVEPAGRRTIPRTITYLLAMIIVSILPVWFGTFGWAYATAAIGGGLMMAVCAIDFIRSRTLSRPAARRLFVASIIYLPVIFVGVLLGG